MKRKSGWCCGLVLVWAGPACADPAVIAGPVVLAPANSYRLPCQSALILPLAADTPVIDYGAVPGLKTRRSQAMALANVPIVIPGPELSYRAGRHGPLMEIGALGGGMDSAPSLAHVGVDWIF